MPYWNTVTAIGKSNKKLVKNAISRVCLAGHVVRQKRERALQALETHGGENFILLLNAEQQLSFEALYAFDVISTPKRVSKIFGSGPGQLKPPMIKKFFKYNSASQSFVALDDSVKEFTRTTDAVALDRGYLRSLRAERDRREKEKEAAR